MTECLIGGSIDWTEGIPVVENKKLSGVQEKIGYDQNLSRIIILNKANSDKRFALIVNRVLGVVTSLEEGINLIHQFNNTKAIRLSEFDITKIFIT